MNKHIYLSEESDTHDSKINSLINVGLYVAGGLLLILIAGQIFRIFAYTANSYWDMKTAFKRPV